MERALGRRVAIGREVRVLHETSDEVHLEGRARLSPGQLVELVFASSRDNSSSRRALVLCWAVFALSNEGAIYRGICRWRESGN